MSNINDIVRSAQGGQLIDNLADRFGLASWQIEAALVTLAPALFAALTKTAESPETLRPIVAMIAEPQHKAAFEGAHSQESLEAGETVILHLFGSAAAAGEVSQLAARDCGLRADAMQRLLPALASIVAGGLSSALTERGLDAALSRPAASDAAAAAEPPPEPIRPKKAGGLAGLLAALFGKRPMPAKVPVEPAPAPEQRAEALEEALAQIRQILARDAPVAEDRRAEFDELLGRVLGPPRG